jgi:hypothetical protein
VKPRLLTRFESWHVVALLRHRRHQRESVEVAGLSQGELKALGGFQTGRTHDRGHKKRMRQVG